MRIEIHFGRSSAVGADLRRLFRRLEAVMSVGFDRLRAEVTESATIGASVVTLVNGLSDQIRLLANDPVALAALADELDATNALVAAAVAANTPAVPAPTVDDPVVVPSTDEGFTTV